MAKPDLPPVALHLGAHKTGTTFIQSALLANRDMLAGRGVAFLPLDVMRKVVTPVVRVPPSLLPWTRDPAGDLAVAAVEDAAAAVPACSRIVLSDENILGPVPSLNVNGTLYPKLVTRFAQFQKLALNGRPTTVYLCLRSYERLLPSMYCEAIRHRDFFTFDELMQGFDLTTLSWQPIVRALAEAVGAANLVLWDFEAFIANPAAIVAALAAVPVETLKIGGKARTRRASASGEAITALTALRSSMSNQDIAAWVKVIEKGYPVGKYPSFAPFPQDVANELAARHRADWAAIRKEFPQALVLE